MTAAPPNPAPAQHAQLRHLRARLGRMRTRVRMMVVMRSLLLAMAMILTAVLTLVLIDYMLRLPMGIRLLTLAGLVYLIWLCWARLIQPALQARCSTTDIALEIERRDPSLRGLVASAIDLSTADKEHTASDPDTEALTKAALNTIARRLDSKSIPGIANPNQLISALGVCALVVTCIALLSVRSPNLAQIGLTRTLSPWSMASWPKRFAIEDLTSNAARPVDIAIPIRALIGNPDSSDSINPRAYVSWRVLDANGRPAQRWTRTMLTRQQRSDDGTPIYEQLLDAKPAIKPLSEQSEETSTAFTLEYTIETRDDSQPTRKITLVRPPKLLDTSVAIELPAYAQPIADAQLVRSGTITHTDSDSVLTPILAGSQLSITWRFSKPMRRDSQAAESSIPQWAASLSPGNTIIGFSQPTPTTIQLDLIAQSSAAIEPGVLDEMGITVRTPIILALGVLDDQAPGASLTEPTRDEIVSASAIIELQAELTDDFGLVAGALHASIARAHADSQGAPADQSTNNQPTTLIRAQYQALQRAQLDHTLSLETLGLAAGDEVHLNAIAWDLRARSTDVENASLGMTQSSTRILRVVEDSVIIDDLRKGLGSISGAMRQLDEQQANAQKQLQNQRQTQAQTTSEDQRSVTDRLDASERTIEQLRDTFKRNNLDDAALGSLLDDASAVASEAAQASERASDQLDRGDDERASANQRVVRDRIGELLSMLDRGQDSWLALRSVQQLRDELAALRDDTAEFNASTAGKSLDQLTPEEQSALERILERQTASADDAREAISTLDERAQQLQENDPTQAEALSRAAEQARSAQLEEKLNEAADQIASNQTSSATQTQSEVLDELDEMLEELENAIKNRDNALRRELASIIDSIKALIKAQETQIGMLDNPNAKDLDAGMIGLSGNTLAVRDEALGAFPETRSIADLITQGANAQGNAINALRQSPIDLEAAERHERASLLHLNSALEEANRLDEQAADRQARQLRTQLRDEYRSVLEIQTALRDETLPLVDQQMSRRQRASARAIGISQGAIREQLSELLEQTQELSDAPVFVFAHAQLDRQMQRSVDGLAQRQIESRTPTLQTSSIVILTTLVEVLSDTPPPQEPDDFDDGSQSGSSSGSSGGEEPVIPPVAQLKLLRSMQQLAAMQTREYSENPGLANDADLESLSQLQSQLSEHAKQLIESLNNPQPAPSPARAPTPNEREATP